MADTLINEYIQSTFTYQLCHNAEKTRKNGYMGGNVIKVLQYTDINIIIHINKII